MQPPNNETMTFLWLTKTQTSKAHKKLHFISKKTFFNLFIQSVYGQLVYQKFNLLHHKNDQHFPI